MLRVGRFRIGVCLLLISLSGGIARSHEVDQFCLPDRELEDLGDYWNELLYTAVHKAVESTNRDIRIAERILVPQFRDLLLAELHSPAVLTWRVRQQLPTALLAIERLEVKLRLQRLTQPPREKLLNYRSPSFTGTYSRLPWIPDVRQLNRVLFMRSSLIKVHGTYMGTDKICHFIAMGYLYYNVYRISRAMGYSHERALAHASKCGTMSERSIFGTIPCGIISNGDMAANYVGMKYFLNVTQPVMLRGCQCPAMVMREGNYWRLRAHVNPEGDYFAKFVSEHFDEALNPSLLNWSIRHQMRKALRDHRHQLLDWYAGNDPSRRTRDYYSGILEQCTTYFGEDYGHSGKPEDLISIANTCFDDSPPNRANVISLVAYRRDEPQQAVAAIKVHRTGRINVAAFASFAEKAVVGLRSLVLVRSKSVIQRIREPGKWMNTDRYPHRK